MFLPTIIAVLVATAVHVYYNTTYRSFAQKREAIIEDLEIAPTEDTLVGGVDGLLTVSKEGISQEHQDIGNKLEDIYANDASNKAEELKTGTEESDVINTYHDISTEG